MRVEQPTHTHTSNLAELLAN
jgi:hypothetical protein